MPIKNENIQESVREMYEKYPFPSDPTAYRRYSSSLTELDICAKKNLEDIKNEIILDFGCGTGEITCGLAKRMKDCRLVGIDISHKSIKQSQLLSEKESLTNVSFLNGDISTVKNTKCYDEIFSVGVLHHTPVAADSFDALATTLKEDGYITIGLYNLYGRIGNRVKRFFVNLFAGNNLEKRIFLAKKIFKKQENDIILADKYAHPQETYFSISQVLKWFKKNNISYVGSYPPIEICLYPGLIYLLYKNKKLTLAERDKIKFDYVQSRKVGKFWYNGLFYILVQLFWIFQLKSALFFIRGRKD